MAKAKLNGGCIGLLIGVGLIFSLFKTCGACGEGKRYSPTIAPIAPPASKVDRVADSLKQVEFKAYQDSLRKSQARKEKLQEKNIQKKGIETPTREKNPCGYHNGNPLYRGSRGGCYYYNSSGKKQYVDRSECNC